MYAADTNGQKQAPTLTTTVILYVPLQKHVSALVELKAMITSSGKNMLECISVRLM